MIAKREEEAKAQSKVPLHTLGFPRKVHMTASSLSQPVFLSKKERAELALKKRQDEVAAQRKKLEEERSAREK